MNIYEKLSNIQQELKAPKNQYNSFGKYSYRSCEDIFEAVKPLLAKNKCVLKIEDEMLVLGDNTKEKYTESYYDKDLKRENERTIITGGQRFYIKATAILKDLESEEYVINTAYAREEETKRGMDGSQITGASSSYARKYALNGLFLIDDVKDSDTTNTGNSEEKTVKLASKKQTDYIKTLGIDLVAMCEYYGINDISELTIEQASEIIKKKGNK